MSGKKPSGGAKRPRRSIFFYVTNVLGCYELSVGYKSTKGIVQPLSATRQGASTKVPFGPLKGCEVIVRTGVEQVEEFKFVNKKMQTLNVPTMLLNNLEFQVNDFSRKVTELWVDKKKEVLSKYISLINNSEGFVYHNEEMYSKNGFLLSDEELSNENLEAVGGANVEYEEFVKFARESALMAASPDECLRELAENRKATRKHKVSSEAVVKPPKLSRSDILNKKEKEELEDENGLEKDYRGCFTGLAHIPLANISVCKEMNVQINPFRVQHIKSSIMKRYDPSLSVLVVCPVDESIVCDMKNVGDAKFYIVQKIQCFKAFQELEESGEFIRLHGHHTGKVLCYVLKSNRRDIMEYGSLRENYISSQFARKTLPQDLLHHFVSLIKTDSTVKAIKVVQRMAGLCRIGPDECTALDKFCKWSKVGVEALLKTIDSYERYRTLDVKKSGHQQNLARGDKMAISNVLFRSLAKCPEEFFLTQYELVINCSKSLRDVAEDHKVITNVGKVYAALEVIAKDDIEALKDKYPGKFDFDDMKNFIGAVIEKTQKNEKGKQLQIYFEMIVNSPGSEYTSPVKFATFDTATELFESENLLLNSDMLIYMMKERNTSILMTIINAVLGGEKDFHAVVLIFPGELDYFETISFLRGQQAATSTITGFQLFPLIFRKETRESSNLVTQNVIFGLLFGKFSIFRAPLAVFYESILHLGQVVESICPVKTLLNFVCDKGLPLVKIHTVQFDRTVTYYGGTKEIEKFKSYLSTDKTPIIEEDSDHFNGGESTPSTSTTPAKTPSNRLDDSGFAAGLTNSAELSPDALRFSVMNKDLVSNPSGVVRSLTSTLDSNECD